MIKVVTDSETGTEDFLPPGKENIFMKKITSKSLRFCLLSLLVLALAMTATTCSKKSEETSAPAQSPEDDTFQPDEETTQDSTEETAEETPEAEPAHDAAVASQLESMAAVYDGIARAMYQPDISKDGVAYVPSDSSFFWLAVYFTANNSNEASEEGTFELPAADVQAYAAACFGSSQSLPDIPQDVKYVSHNAEDDTYTFQASDNGDMSASITKAYKNADGTYTATVELKTSEGVLATYEMTLKDNTAEGAPFQYSVTSSEVI